MIVAMKSIARVLISVCLFANAAAACASGVVVQVNDSNGKPVADAVVYLEGEGGNGGAKAPKPGQIEQRGQKFIPLVTVVQTGAKIWFPNNDRVKHHIYSFSPAKKFDQKLYSGVAAPPQVFDKPGTVVLGCNIHDRMLAYVKVVDTPYFAKTDADGVARIELPGAGKYTATVWHYNLQGASPEQALQVKPGDAPTSAQFQLALKPAVVDDAGH